MASQQVLVNVRNTNGRSDSSLLDTNLSLDRIRQNLQTQHYMAADDVFFNTDVGVNRNDERNIRLYQLLGQGNELYIGVPGSIDNVTGSESFTTMTFNQQRSLLGDAHIDVHNGLTIRNGNLTQTNKKLFKFANNYVPSANNPNQLLDSEELYTFTDESHSMQCSGVNSASISLSTPWVSAGVNYDHAKSNSSSRGTVRSYYTKRFLFNKAHLSTDPGQLIIDNEFAQQIKRAVSGHERSISGYENLVGVLNNYGWYIPLEYTLGGAIYSTKSSLVSNINQAREESRTFGGNVSAQFMNIGGGASYSNTQQNASSHNRSTNNERITFKQIGGSTFSENNYAGWENSLKNPSNWRIIRYTSFLPSLMLLHGTDNAKLSICLRLLTKYNTYSQVKSLQPYIDVQEYENTIAYETNPRYGN